LISLFGKKVIDITCIVGYLDLVNDCTWIGGDSCGSNGYTKSIELQSKVFRNRIFKNVIMGSTSTFRHIDLLKYSKTLFEEVDFYKDTKLDHEYMVTKFIPNLIKLFNDGIKDEKDENKGANFIIGTKNKIFEVQQDYSVLEPEDGYTSVGCGESIALGSLYSTKSLDIPIPDKIKIALEAAEHVACGVQRPFRIINTKNEKEITIT
jgi:ATP-dependent protease HslVU (ClpYQ) peptidase subunit